MIDFIKENYEWLFSGIGVTFLVWVIHCLKKATKAITLNQAVFTKLLKKKKDLPPKYLTLTRENGSVEKAEVILAFEFKDTKREYVVYTKNETDKYGNVTVYVSEVDRNSGKPVLLEVPDGKEWKRVREVLKELAESKEEQPLFDEDGIEII